MTPDHVTFCFALTGAALTWLNVRRVWKDKGYAGVTLPAVVLFTCWGLWNLYFYHSLEQYWTMAANVVVASANLSWLGLMLYFGRKA